MTASRATLTTTDVAVIGAGPAGIAAATRLAESGRRVVLVDESPAVGGQIWRHRPGMRPHGVAARWISRLERSAAIIECGTSVVDLHVAKKSGRFVVAAEQRGAPLIIHAESLVLATGARERFLPFPGWTLPGVVGVGGAQALLKSGLSVTGKRVVIAGSGPLLLPVADALSRAGARVLIVAEQAATSAVVGFAVGLWRRPGTLVQAMRHRAAFARTPYRTGLWASSARGDGRLQEVTLTDGAREHTIACDMLCVGYGLLPNTQLPRLLGCHVDGGATVVDEHQQTSILGAFAVGESTGVGGVDLALVEGELAAVAIVGDAGRLDALIRRRAALAATAAAMERAFAPRAELRDVATPGTVVCRCEDATVGAMDARWSARQAKLYTRAGMGPCQGRICGPALEFIFGWPADTVRMPAEPALLSTLLAEEGDPAPAPHLQGASR
jgi:NADPH-dependent 2,4-dienoyl-CoA reductase/sulfur reductase-like enzyme